MEASFDAKPTFETTLRQDRLRMDEKVYLYALTPTAVHGGVQKRPPAEWSADCVNTVQSSAFQKEVFRREAGSRSMEFL